MPFIPHTETDIEQMLATIGVAAIEDLFDEIPQKLRCDGLQAVPPGLSEMEVGYFLQQRAKSDGLPSCFIGAGAYDHHIPAAVWEVATRGEFYSAYTPYQAEASQGTLQLIYEFQTMIASLTGMDVSNASMYDGATALAEAVLMAVRAKRGKPKKILMPATIHPVYRKVVETIVTNQQITLQTVGYDAESGTTVLDQLPTVDLDEYAALVIPYPNFFGMFEQVEQLTDWAHQNKLLVIAVVNPVALGLLQPPGSWGTNGADIVVGEGQPLGIPLSSGGPYLGFMACKQDLVRQMPGRIVGKTVDTDGKQGFALTLQAREQHIRRSKATSNICTNQGLMATAATIHMSVIGAAGLESVARQCHSNTRTLVEQLVEIAGVNQQFTGPFFHEAVITLSQPAEEIIRALAAQDVLAGYPLGNDYPELPNSILVCATEKRMPEEITKYVTNLDRIMARRTGSKPVCTNLKPTDPTAWGFSGK